MPATASGCSNLDGQIALAITHPYRRDMTRNGVRGYSCSLSPDQEIHEGESELPHTKINAALFLPLLFSCTIPVLAVDFEIRDASEFRKLVPSGAKVDKLAGDMGFIEGPVWLTQDGGFLVFSDIPNNELKKWSSERGLSTFRKPSQRANGNTVDRQGRLVSAEHAGRRISITERNGIVSTVVSSYDGRKFNSPNDVVVRSDGTFWFTDPPYGVPSGDKQEQEGSYVFRYEPGSKRVTVVIKDSDRPNGLCFSPDERKLYVSDSGKPHHIREFSVKSDGSLSDARVFAVIDKGVPDGIRCDADGRVWSSAGDGVRIYISSGQEIGRILVPEAPTNLAFGGKDGKTLFITARTSLYAIRVSVTEAKRR